MADIVRLKDRIPHRSVRPGTRSMDAEILMFTGVRYEAPSGWLKPTDIVTGALIGGPLQLGGPLHGGGQISGHPQGAKDPKPR